jgi:hypothetical protein
LRQANERDLRAQGSETAQRIAAIHPELDAVEQLLVDHERQRAEMQEKLRRAFMRGVVNLTLEAMNIFSEIPTAEGLPVKKQRGRPRQTRDGADDFVVEPARVSVIRHCR